MSSKLKRPDDRVILVTETTASLTANEFDHPSWQKAPPIQINRYWSGKNAPAGRQAEARIIWTSEALCVRFYCRQTEPLVVSLQPRSDKKTIGLWDRDVCEIFLAPGLAEPDRYFEFEAAPTGEWIDLAIHLTPDKRETDWEFHSGMTAAARVANDRVWIGMRIPWDHWIHRPQ